MKVGIAREVFPGERRVAGNTDTVQRLRKLGFEVLVEKGAGALAMCADTAYVEAGATLRSAKELWDESDIVIKVRPPMDHPELKKHETELLKDGSTLISFFWPAENKELIEKLKGRPVNVIAMDAVPRISRAQKLDALSSMANMAGYRAIIEAANQFGRFFTGQITAAGKMPPAKVMIIGAGVAGLAAIGAAKGLGAIVRAFDTRPEVKEQVESMGAEFLEVAYEEDGSGEGGYAKLMSPEFIAAEMALFEAQARDVDIIVTTALIPGKKAPILITEKCARMMKPGSVIVDLAAERGGNCELTVADEIKDYDGVKVIGYTDLPGRMALQASQAYGTNLCHMLDELGKAEGFKFDLENEVVRGSLIIHEGELIWPPPKVETKGAPKAVEKPKVEAKPASVEEEEEDDGWGTRAKKEPQRDFTKNNMTLALGGTLLLLIGYGAPQTFLMHLTVFVLAIFVGYQIIWNVTAALHTPLMSVTNAISGIIIVAGLLQVTDTATAATSILGAIAVLVATINISGGFLVTQRMLKMFHR